MIISPKYKKCLVEVGEYKGQLHTTVWRMGEFVVEEYPEMESDGSLTLNPSSLVGCWDEWETTIPTELRKWDFDKQPILEEDFRKNYQILHYKIIDGFEVNGVKVY